jgi:hypothetical protein
VYELEIRRRRNGETIEVIPFLSRKAWDEARDKIISKYGLQRLRGSKRRDGEDRYGGFDENTYDFILVSRTVSMRPEVRALAAARRAFVGGGEK